MKLTYCDNCKALMYKPDLQLVVFTRRYNETGTIKLIFDACGARCHDALIENLRTRVAKYEFKRVQ